MTPRRATGLAVLALALGVAGLVATRSDDSSHDIPPEAARWYGAMSLYRSLAVWAGKRAMCAEIQYWKATTS
ncbi:hypothetical protein [Streptomyces sp. NPDC056264]|uniref:hypothetical protein n=1 Tax=Streptomyces sp. NPDC056264 TaxID=3345767 RepID=UPI003AB0495E